MNIAQFIARAARTFSDRIAIAHGTTPYATYGELAVRAGRLAQHLRYTLGLDAGERVALFMNNCPEYFEVLASIWWGGLTALPIDAKLHPNELAYILSHSGARYCFVTPELAQASAAHLGESRTIDVRSARYRTMFDEPREVSIHWNVPDDIAWLSYASATTGQPKGVMLSHRNLLAMSLCYIADVDPIGSHDCIVHAASTAHGSGLYALPHFAAAAPQVVAESGEFEPAEIVRLANHWRGTALFATPTQVKRLIGYVRSASPALDMLKTVVYRGPMPLADIKDALTVMGQRFAQIHGRSESAMTITALSKLHLADRDHPRYDARLSSVGVAQSAVEVRVVDDEDRTLPDGEAGAVVVRGEPVMRGYWRDAPATAAALTHGWLHTGDVGTFDRDGFLTLLDRS